MIIDYDTMEDIFDDESIVNFSKPNRKKTHPTGQTKYDDPWYKDEYRYAIDRSLPKIKGLLKKNIGKDFGKVRNEIIQKCSHNDYDKYLIRDYLQYRVFSYTELFDSRLYLYDEFYVDKNGKLQYRAKPDDTKTKNNKYATFRRPENERTYYYEFRENFRKSSKLLEDSIKLVFCKKFPDWFDYRTRRFNEDEVDMIVDELISLAPLIKSVDPEYYKYYKHFHYRNRVDVDEKEIDRNFIKSYLFGIHCANPYITVEKNSQEYWKLRKLFNKNK